MEEGENTKETFYKSFDELPLMLIAENIRDILSISISSAYDLMHEKGFPILRIGMRMVVPKEKFEAWVEQNTNK